MRFKLVCFDFDHTLTLGTTAAEHVADLLGCRSTVDEAERKFRSGEMTTSQFTDAVAFSFQGRGVAEVAERMCTIPLVAEISETVAWLKDLGLRVVINTVGFRDLMLPLGGIHGFDEVSGVRLSRQEDHYTGGVDAYFPVEHKVLFARAQAGCVGAELSEVIAIGDGLSDVPLFESVGRSIAFNAPAEVRTRTHAAAEGNSCAALRPIIESFIFDRKT